MLEHIIDASEPWGQVDIRVGMRRRRRWSDDVKGLVMAESYASGAVVSEVARQHRPHGPAPEAIRPRQLPTFGKRQVLSIARGDVGEELRSLYITNSHDLFNQL
jgi:hypothetical protein